MSSYILFRTLRSVQLHNQSYIDLQNKKEKLDKSIHQITPLLKKILRNQDDICRICLQSGSQSIFESAEDSKVLAAEIQFALAIEINQNDGGPQKICTSCKNGVFAAAELKRLANVSTWRLEQEAEMLKTSDVTTESFNLDSTHGGYFDVNNGVVERFWRCGKCRKSFRTQEEFNDHEAQVSCRRRRVDPYVCEVCGKEFRRAFLLNQHRAIHNNEFPYACTICSYRGRTRAGLIGHIKLHSGEKPIHCPHCPATFASYSNLGSHRRTHYPPRYKCLHCNRSFIFQQSLKNHLITQHSSIKAYHCAICDKSFALSKHLRQHELKAHNRPKCTIGAVPLYIKQQLHDCS